MVSWFPGFGDAWCWCGGGVPAAVVAVVAFFSLLLVLVLGPAVVLLCSCCPCRSYILAVPRFRCRPSWVAFRWPLRPHGSVYSRES